MQAQVVAAVAEWMPVPVSWLLVWLLKGSLLLALLFPVAALLRPFSSSARHLLWTVGLAVALALPLASTGVLPWRLEVPLMRALTPAPSSSESAGMSNASAQTDATERARLDSRTAVDLVAGGDDSAARLTVSSRDGLTSSGPSAGSPPSDSHPYEDAEVTPSLWSRIGSGIGWLRLSILVWGAGAGLLLTQLGRSAIHARRLVRNGTPLTGSAWTTPLIEAADRLDLPDLPRLLVNADAAMPLTCGIVRPAIVLPPASETWTDERRRAVLCHELGHIRRRDLVSHLLGRVTCALYWFQPLAWSAARRMRAESERACDDLVLLTGTRPSAYADHLLEIAAAGHGGVAPAVAMPMAQPREFEARLLSILEPDKRREPLSRLQAAVLAGLVLVLAQPLVALTPARTSSPQPSTPQSTSVAAAEDERGDEQPVPAEQQVDPESTTASSSDERSAAETPPAARESAGAAPAPEPAPAVGFSDDGVPVITAPSGAIIPAGGAAPADTGRRERQRTLEREIERGAEAVAETVTDATLSMIGGFFGSLGDQGAQADPRVRAGLIEALRDPAPAVRRTAAWTLSTQADSAVVLALANALRSDEDARVREMSAWALAELDASASNEDAVDALAHAVVSDENVEVRATAAWALSNARSSTAISALGRAVQNDATAPVREAAAWALGSIGESSSIPPLAEAMAFDDAEVRETTAWAIGVIQPDRAPDRLVAGLRDAAPRVRKATAWALGRIADPETAPALGEALSDEDSEVRSAALWALGGLPGDASADALVSALRDPDPEVRAAAAAALGGHGSNPWPWPRPRPRPRPQP